MSNYEIRLSRSARRDMNRLPEKIREVVVEFIYGALADNPQRVGHPLNAPYQGQHTAVRGTYRVTYRIVQNQVLVEVMRVAHRSDVYRL